MAGELFLGKHGGDDNRSQHRGGTPGGSWGAAGLTGVTVLFAIYTAGLLTWVEEYVSEAERLSFVNNLGWVATGRDVYHVLSRHLRCTAKSIEWGSWRGPQLATANTEAADFTRGRGHRKHLRPEPTSKI